MSAYCTTADVYRWVRPEAFQNPARLISSISASTEILTLDGHGFATDDELLFRVEAGGTIAGPLVAGTTYYAIPLTDSTFSVAATAGGAAIDITSAGSNVVVVSQLPWDGLIADVSAELEDTVLAHAVPLATPYPTIVVSYAAALVAARALRLCGGYDETLAEEIKRVRADLMMWRKGKNLRGATGQTSTNLAVRSSVAGADPRGWAQRGNDVIP